jgi:glycosyltransferase involved in cell wall biosynthesis
MRSDNDRLSKVEVGIVTRNRASILPKAIDSARSQGGVNLFVRVVNDGSTDDTSDIARRYPDIGWTDWPTSRGYVATRNYLMQNADADYFVSLDDDAWFVKGDEISTALKFLEENLTTGAIAFDILSPDRNATVSRHTPQPISMFIGCGHVVRLSAAREVGLYDIAPGSYGGEEKDFCLRLIDAGYKTMLLPGVHVWHDKTSVERDIPNQHRSGVCNDLVMTFRRTPAWLLPIALLSKVYRHLIFSMKHRLIKPCFEGFGMFLRSVPRIWSSRKAVKTSTLRTFMKLRQT